MVGRQVDVGLVGRRSFDPAARRKQDGRDLVADTAVGLEIAGPDHGLGAQPLGLGEGQAGVHAPGARLGAGGRHQARGPGAAAYDQGPPAQGRVEAALDRDEERVEVDVQDPPRPLLHEDSLAGRRQPPREVRTTLSAAGPWGGPNDSW